MENKASKYFKYAIGEIVLVVIGILIALQINNWNENRKNSIRETQFLKSFRIDLLANKEELKRVIGKTEITFKSSDSILKFKRGQLKDFNLVGAIMDGTGFTVYKTQEGTIQDILGSGNLDIIKNDSIRLNIGSWEANLKDIREWEKLDKNACDAYMNYLKKNIDLYNIDNGQLILDEEIKNKLMNDRLFLNNIADRMFLPKVLNNIYNIEAKRIDNLLDKVNTELDNN